MKRKRIEVNITDEELDELREGKEFDWVIDGTLINLANKEEGED